MVVEGTEKKDTIPGKTYEEVHNNATSRPLYFSPDVDYASSFEYEFLGGQPPQHSMEDLGVPTPSYSISTHSSTGLAPGPALHPPDPPPAPAVPLLPHGAPPPGISHQPSVSGAAGGSSTGGPVMLNQGGPRAGTYASYVLVDTDPAGVVWIKFEYTRDRVKWLYKVRCDVETVDEQQLPADFKDDNCIYPKAMVPASEYRGHRQRYESECNHLGWRLAWLNPDLRNRRGLIQRAVDSYRNSSADMSVRSRRVRRLAKQRNPPRR